MFRPKNDLRERILASGQPGTGKSHAWLKIAEMSQKTNSPAKFYCIDTDDAIERMLLEGFPNLENVDIRLAFSYPEMSENAAELKKIAKPGDWIIFDMIAALWEEAQEYYIQQVMGERSSDYFLKVRKMMQDNEKDGSPVAEGLDGWRDWGQINKMNTTVMKDLIGNRAHVYMTSPIDKYMPAKREEKADRLLYGEYGVKPRGQKKLGHWFHTMLWLHHQSKESYTMTSLKDRGRKVLDEDPLRNFALDYLVKVAGWKL